ncbi:putative AP-5 complex subunit mu-1, partial [Apostichopus japonicus]
MSLRGIWVFSLPGATHGILFSKKYPSVENRARILNKDGYVKLPTDDAMREAVLAELGIVHPIEMFVESRDSCSRKLQKPVFEITTSNGILWPVVLYEKFGLLLCCLPLVESVERPPVIDVLGISLGYALLLQMIDVIGPVQQGVDETHPQMVDLHSYLCQAVPFGTLTDIEQATVFDAISGRIDSSYVVSDVKPPSWRPISVKCKANISFRVTEQIQAVLYNRPDVWDVFQIYGSVSCKADLEHPAPLIAVHLSVGKDQPRLQNILVNSCVSMVDDENRTKGEGHRTITFIPPRERFVLCKYTAAISPTQLSAPNTSTTDPFQTWFSDLPQLHHVLSDGGKPGIARISASEGALRNDGLSRRGEIIMKVKLSKGKNMFEYCEVQIPFHNRGPIIYKENTQSTGEIVITNDKRTLAWRIGQKFPSRSHEVTLEAKLKFGNRSSIIPGQDDPFCVGLNSFAMIYFKIPDYTHTSATIDQRSLRVQPNAKPKVTV